MKKHPFLVPVCTLGLAILSSGCVFWGKTEKESPASPPQVQRVPTRYNLFQYLPEGREPSGSETLLAAITSEVAGKVFYQLREDGEKAGGARVAVVNAVPLSDFKRDTEFGRVVGEFLLTDLADRGVRVTELRLGREINILPQTGEFILSRNIGELAHKSPELEYVVLSTFSNTQKTLILQGRMIRLKDGLVKSSWRHTLPLTRELRAFFQAPEEPYRIAVKGVAQ